MNHQNQRSMFSSSTQTETKDLLTKHVEVYNTFPYGSQEHYDFVRHHFENTPEAMATRLVLPPSHNPESDQNVIKSLLFTSPVYWGKDRSDLHSWDQVEANLGYNLQSTQMSDTEVSATRYARVGPIKVMAHGDLPEREANLIHIWGFNAESDHTADYNTCIRGKSETEFKALYRARHLEALHMIIFSAVSSLKDDETAYIKSALFGAGVFLKALSVSMHELALQLHLEAVREVLNHYQALITAGVCRPFVFNMCIFTPGDFPDWYVEGYQTLAGEFSDIFTVGIGSKYGNVLANVPYEDPKTRVFVVNAGDPKSFIGNGMSKDATVEGFLIANARGFNNPFRNTGFLHNTRFNPELIKPETWVRM